MLAGDVESLVNRSLAAPDFGTVGWVRGVPDRLTVFFGGGLLEWPVVPSCSRLILQGRDGVNAVLHSILSLPVRLLFGYAPRPQSTDPAVFFLAGGCGIL